MRALVLSFGVAALLAPGASAGARIVDSLDLDDYSGRGAVGLAVPGAGPTVTRESALNTLLTGDVRSSIVGGALRGTPAIDLESGDPPDVLVVLPPEGGSTNGRYPIAVVGGGADGVLTSSSTRIPGLVSLADVATGRLRWVADDDPVRTLAALEARIDRNDRIRVPFTLLLVAATFIATLLRPRWAPRVFLLAIACNLWLAGWWVTALLALAAVALPLGWASATVICATLLVLWLDPVAVALSPLGPSQAGRFYGVSNLLETALLVPALLGAALLGRLGIVLAAISIVAVAGSGLGADGGGLLVLLFAFAVLALRLNDVRLGLPRAAAIVASLVIAGTAFVGLDAALGASSHVTDAVTAGPGEVIGDIGTRLEISVRRTAGALPALVVAISLGMIAWIATRRPRTPITDALLAGLAISLLANDTPSDVLAVGAAAAFALSRWERWSGHDTRIGG